MAMSAEHRSKFAALHRQWWRLHMSEKFANGTINPKQTNKQTKNQIDIVLQKEVNAAKLFQQIAINRIPRLLH